MKKTTRKKNTNNAARRSQISEQEFTSALDTVEAYLEGIHGLTTERIDSAIATARAYLDQRIEKCLAKLEGRRRKGGAR